MASNENLTLIKEVAIYLDAKHLLANNLQPVKNYFYWVNQYSSYVFNIYPSDLTLYTNWPYWCNFPIQHFNYELIWMQKVWPDLMGNTSFFEDNEVMFEYYANVGIFITYYWQEFLFDLLYRPYMVKTDTLAHYWHTDFEIAKLEV